VAVDSGWRDTVYAKVFSSLWRGSLRGHSNPQHVFIYLLAHADELGTVEAMPQAIADETGLSMEAVCSAIAHLESPDPESRSPEDEGRRIQRLDEHRSWAWLITNYERYREMSDREKVREQTKERMRKLRERKGLVTLSDAPLRNVTQNDAKQKQKQKQRVEVEAEVENTQLPSALASGRKRKSISRKSLENGEALPEGEITADQAFEEVFWPEYPRKRDKEDARKAWKSLKLLDDDEEKIRSIMAALRRDLKQEWRDRNPDHVPYPAHWLRRKGWMD
jgi:hypothetical protein